MKHNGSNGIIIKSPSIGDHVSQPPQMIMMTMNDNDMYIWVTVDNGDVGITSTIKKIHLYNLL